MLKRIYPCRFSKSAFSSRISPVTRLLRVFVYFVILTSVAVISYTRMGAPAPVYAATSSNLNFQARLLSNAGNVVPDGFYNIEFNLYSASTGGTSEWTETRTGGSKVRVVNGYLSANLGDVSGFPPTIDWDQDHWLTMNIGGSGTPVWDGEMTPRIKLTAVPYAFQAKQSEILNKTTGANTGILDFLALTADRNINLPDQDGTLCIQGSPDCVDVSTTNTTATTSNNSGLEISADGLRLLGGCSDGQSLKWNATAKEWQCTSSSGSSIGVRESDGSPTIAADIIEFGPPTGSDSEFIVTNEGSGVSRIRLGNGVLTLSNYASTLDAAYVNVGESPAAGDVSGSFTAGLSVNDVQNNAVDLGAETVGDYVQNLGTMVGLSITGTNSGEGSTPGLSVTYGSAANTAVQGNTQLTCAAGSGDLTGGGTVITLGSGGSCGSITISEAPVFDTSVTSPLFKNAGGLLALQAAASAGADDIVFSTAGSEKLRILENGQLFFEKGTNDATIVMNTPSGAAATYTFDGASGTVLTTANFGAAGGLDAAYVNVGESPAAGDVSGSFTAGLSVNDVQNNAVDLGAETVGDYVQNLGTMVGLSITGTNSGEGSTPGLSVTYGSAANTAVQGNTQLTCAAGSGDLTGGGTVITLGSGGSCGSITISEAPVFDTSVTSPLFKNAGGLLALQAAASAGADDIVFSTAGSEKLRILENGQLFFEKGTNDATIVMNTPSGAAATYTFDGASGTVLTTANFGAAGGLDAAYVNVGESPAAGDVSGSFTAGLSVNDVQNNAVDLGAETVGDYVQNLGTMVGLSITGTNSGEGSTPGLSVTYGSAANTAVQGNTQLTCAAGSGDLTGGGTVITLGSGGSCGSITISEAPVFDTSVTSPLFKNAGGLLALQAAASAGADDIVFSTAGSEKLRILENGQLFFEKGTNDATIVMNTPSGAAATYTFDGASGTVLTTANFGAAGGLDAAYVNVGESPAAGDVSGSFTAGLSVNDVQNNAVDLGAETVGDYVQNLGTMVGLSITGTNSGEGSTPGLSVTYGAAANTAVQGNTQLTCAAGSGDLTGGGTVITLGSGGSCGSITISEAPVFDTSVTSPLFKNAGGLLDLQAAASAGADDIVFSTAGSEKLRILENGQLFFEKGTNDATIVMNTPSGAAATYTFDGASGTVLTTANFGAAGGLDAAYVNVGESPAAGDVSGSFTAGLSVNDVQNNAVDLGAETVGDYVQNLGTMVGLSITGTNSGEGSTPGLSVTYGAAANTAVQGNTQLTCAAGSGDLTGGGTVITLGSGGSCGSITISEAPVFDTSVTSPLFKNAGGLLDLQAAASAGADDIVFSTAGSEKLRILENGQLFFEKGTNDATIVMNTPSGAAATYTFDGASGTVLTTANFGAAGGLDAAYVNVGESPAAGDVSGSFTAGLSVNDVQNNAVDLGAETVGDYVQNLGTMVGLSITGTNSGEGSTPGLSVTYGAAANTAVQGNTQLTCAAGSGDLTGGGTVITLGSGGSCGSITISEAPVFDTSVTSPLFKNAGGLLDLQAAASAGADDIVFSTAGSEKLRILENGQLFFEKGTNDATIVMNTPSGAAATYTFDGASGTVLTTANFGAAGGLDAAYVNVGESPAAGDVSGSFTAGLSVNDVQNNAVDLGAETVGDYVQNLGTMVGLSITGTNSGEGSTPGLSVTYGAAANTAVQGNTQLTCAAGSGDLTGGGTVITLGSGGSCGSITISEAPVFDTSVTTPLVTNAGALTLSTTGANNLTISSGSGLVNLGASTIATTSGLTFNMANASDTAFTINNSGAGLANLNVEGQGTFGTGLVVTSGSASITGNSTINGTFGTYTTGYNLMGTDATLNAYGYFRSVSTSDTVSRFEIGAYDIFGSGGGRDLVLNPLGGNVGVGGDLTPDGLFSVGSTSQFQVNASGLVSSNGVTAGSGLIQGTGGLTITGAFSIDGAIFDPTGNLVLNDITDIGSAATGLQVAIDGSLLDIDGSLVLNDQVLLGSSTTGLQITTAGAITDLDGTAVQFGESVAINGNLLVQQTATGAAIMIDRTDGVIASLKSGLAKSGFFFDNAGSFSISTDTRGNISTGTGSGTDIITALANGSVGIGTSAPDSRLHITGGGLCIETSDSGCASSSGTAIIGSGLTILAGGANITGGIDNNSGNITETGSITGVGANITGTTGLTLASGGSGDLTLDSASNKIVISDTDSTLQRNAAGTTTIDLNNAATTTLTLDNLGAGIANLNVASGVYQQAGLSGVTVAACTAGQYIGNGVRISGGITTAGTCRNDATGISDARVKKDVTSVGSVLDKLNSVNVVSFNFKVEEMPELNLDHGLQYGVIAQELEQIFPELVKQREDGYKEVNFQGLSFYNLKAVGEIAKHLNSQGNASLNAVSANTLTVNGDITAGTIRADRIEGLEYNGRFESLEARVNNLEQQPASQGNTQQIDLENLSIGNLTANGNAIINGETNVQKLTVNLDLIVQGAVEINGPATFKEMARFQKDVQFDGQINVLGYANVQGLTVNLNLIVQGALEVKGPATFKEMVRFEKDAQFDGNVAVKGQITLNSDTAGTAVVKAGETSVKVKFSKPKTTKPVISLTLGDGKFAQYSYKNVTEEEFEIILASPALEDMALSWIALSADPPPPAPVASH